ncbi:MAG: HAD family phosphatase [Boseongicola sp.]|nr:HAD family phosphatase [Boseongicola sp.]
MIEALLHTGTEVLEMSSGIWKDEIVRRDYDAFVFDCDGTLVESSEVHFQSFYRAIAEQGWVLERNWYLDRTGLDRVSLFREFSADGTPLDIELACARSIDVFVSISNQVAVIPETELLVQALSQVGPMAVGTNAEKQVAEASLQATGLGRFFDHIVAVSDGLPPKPAPDIFQHAARLLGSDQRVLVLEDSAQGVAAARAGGFDVVQLL